VVQVSAGIAAIMGTPHRGNLLMDDVDAILSFSS
jgi:hypothetical protein